MSTETLPGGLSLLVISTSRSEFGQVAPLARLAGCPLVVAGMHHDSATPTAAESAGLDLIRLPRPQDSLGLVHQVALREVLAARKPDAVVILGDRFELLELAVPLVLADTVIAHLSGGERTAGAIDDQVRNAVSQLAHLHYPPHALAAERLVQMGVDPWRVCVAGEPGLDAIRDESLLRAEELSTVLGVRPEAGDVLVALHPVTRDPAETAACIDALVATAVQYGRRWFVSTPNGDPGSELIASRLRGGTFVPFGNHGARFFRSLAAACGTQIGNSSAGLVEAPSLGCATIDLGTRQQGRPRGASVATITAPTVAALISALARVSELRQQATPEANPYGDGRTCARILAHLRATLPRARQVRPR
jgi:UDP-N-acetylglucosamine 2-epimerase (non-hydrolysing)/GDP/UDP-N,N'-diacetylbacillosamine 2-epimerase (hydrolysing)